MLSVPTRRRLLTLATFLDRCSAWIRRYVRAHTPRRKVAA